MHVYKKRPDIKCMVHTHPFHVSALSQIGVPLHISHMDVMGLYREMGFLAEWPGIPFGDEEGEIIAGVLGATNWAALLAHHGLIVGGRTIEEATYRAYFFEQAAEMQLKVTVLKVHSEQVACAHRVRAFKVMAAFGHSDLSRLPQVDKELAQRAHDWRISDGPVKAHFNSWARQALRKGHGDALTGKS